MITGRVVSSQQSVFRQIGGIGRATTGTTLELSYYWAQSSEPGMAMRRLMFFFLPLTQTV